LEETYFCGLYVKAIKTALKSLSQIRNCVLCKFRWNSHLIFAFELFTASKVSETIFQNLGFEKHKFLFERFHLSVHVTEELIFLLQSCTDIIHVLGQDAEKGQCP
jgi:hypothetical protein